MALCEGTRIVVEITQNYGGTNINEGQAISVGIKFVVIVENRRLLILYY